MVKIKQLDCYFSFFFVVRWISSRGTLYFVSWLLSICLLDCSAWIAENSIVNSAWALAFSSFGNLVRSRTFDSFSWEVHSLIASLPSQTLLASSHVLSGACFVSADFFVAESIVSRAEDSWNRRDQPSSTL